MIAQLKQVGIFDRIAGMIVADFQAFDHNEQLNDRGQRLFFEDMLKEMTPEHTFPIMKMGDLGHDQPGTYLPLGGEVSFDTDTLDLSISAPCVG